MFAVYKKELRSYFTSPIGYILMAIFCAVTGVFFTASNIFGVYSDMSALYQFIMLWILMIYSPILTMKLMSEEKKLKTDQLLLTSPVTPTGIVVGKFLSALTFFAISLSVTLLYAAVTYAYGSPVTAMLIGNLFGTLMLGAALIAIGLFLSSLTESQVVAAFSSFGVIILLILIQNVGQSVSNPVLAKLIELVSIYSKAMQFQTGVFDISSILYYVSIVAIFLFLTVRVIEKKRWS